MYHMENQRFHMLNEQETQLKRTRTAAIVLAVLLVLTMVTAVWLVIKLEQTNQAMTNLLSDAQQLLQEKTTAESELEKTRQELAETEAQFEESFNLLYPAYVAVENIRYIGAGSDIYHYFSCERFADDEIYTAHNSEYCEKLGYTPCPACCP